MVERIDAARASGDTLGGVFQLRARGMPVGLGSNRQPGERLDACIASALMSIQTVKAVEIGEGIADSKYAGSASHDAFALSERGAISRSSNRAGGIEGGMSNGEELVARVRVKPIATLLKPLPSVDLATGAQAPASIVRSDVCAVPAASLIGEAMLCLALAQAFAEKYGGDSLAETREHFASSQAGSAQLFLQEEAGR
jgi:chorismate synthase